MFTNNLQECKAEKSLANYFGICSVQKWYKRKMIMKK